MLSDFNNLGPGFTPLLIRDISVTLLDEVIENLLIETLLRAPFKITLELPRRLITSSSRHFLRGLSHTRNLILLSLQIRLYMEVDSA